MALLGLLQSLDPERVDVDLFVYSHEGELMNLIPGYVNLLPENKVWSMYEKPLKSVLLKGCLGMAVARTVAMLLMRNYVRKNNPKDGMAVFGYAGRMVSKILPDLHQYGKYDLAVSFLTPHNFVLEHVLAKKKICWIHTDYSYVDVNAELELPVWSGYDYIASISSAVTKAFIGVFPSLESRIVEIENILSPEFVRFRASQISQESVSEEMSGGEAVIKLLSIGRFCEQKNFDSVPDICRRIVQSGCDARWYIIGFGGDEKLIRQKIAETGMEDKVVILGKKDNPYPYMEACDIYVQPSRYEGKSVTVREAQILCKPVVITDYSTADSQIRDGIDGVIVPMDNEGCAEGLLRLMNDTEKQQRIIDYLKEHNYGNEGEVEKIYKVLDL